MVDWFELEELDDELPPLGREALSTLVNQLTLSFDSSTAFSRRCARFSFSLLGLSAVAVASSSKARVGSFIVVCIQTWRWGR